MEQNGTTTVCVEYYLSEDARKRIFAITGALPKKKQTVALDFSSATPEQRAIVAECLTYDYQGNPGIDIKRVTENFGAEWTDEPGFLTMADVITHCQRMAVEYRAKLVHDDLELTEKCALDLDECTVRYLKAIDNRDHSVIGAHLNLSTRANADRLGLSRELAHYQATVEEYVERQPRFKAEHEESLRKANEAAEAVAEEKKIRAEQDRLARIAWAKEHGSETLRRGLEAGHPCIREYFRERARLEYPQATLDFEKNSDWKTRSAPSLDALNHRDDLLKKHPAATVTIVWLTSEPLAKPLDEEEYDDFVECEAIVIDDPDYPCYLVYE